MQKVQHFTDKELSILEYFYKHRLGHVRKIKKVTGLSEHTLLKYLKELETKKVLTSKEQGNLKIFEVNAQNPLVIIFFSYFDILRLNDLEYKRKRAIEEFLRRLKEIKIPYFILVFGSTSKGDYTKYSDIDLITVYDIYNKNINAKISSLVGEILAETGLKINQILMNLKEFIIEKDNKSNYALQDALQTGYPIFGNVLFYEVIFK